MALIKSYISLSDHYGINPSKFDNAGIFDPLLTADTPLFIDPLLLGYSNEKLIKIEGKNAFINHFKLVLDLLRKNKLKDDPYWKAAYTQLSFPEVEGICLGYGGATIKGRGAGKILTTKLMDSAKSIVDIGYDDPFLFPVLAVLEAGYGADRISDMTANVIEEVLCGLTQQLSIDFGIETRPFHSRSGKRFLLPVNPYVKPEERVLLVPLDILRKLPIAKDWYDVMDAASENDALRYKVNRYIGDIFLAKTKEEKKTALEILKKKAISNAEAFSTVMEMVDSVKKIPYDYKKDPDGFIFWRKVTQKLSDETIILKEKSLNTGDDAIIIVQKIIDNFKHWIENRRHSTELWNDDGTPRKEKSAQKIFFIIADQICKHNDIDISPETDSGGGPVDFKFSVGYEKRIVVEIKLSTNSKIISGLTNQLEAYRDAEKAIAAFYVVIEIGDSKSMPEKLLKAKNQFNFMGKRPSEIIFIDGNPRKSASKL